MAGMEPSAVPADVPVAILAGGLGTRLGEATARTPKSLVAVAGEPFVAHQLRLLHDRGVRKVVLCVGHFGEAIREYVGNGERWGLAVTYSADGPRLLGTAGALRQALPQLGEIFFVIYGDSYLEADYTAPLQRLLDRRDALGLMTVYENRDRWVPSNTAVEQGLVTRYDKRSPSGMGYVDYGLGVLRAGALEDGGETDLGEVYARLAANRRLLAHPVCDRFYEVGSPQGRVDADRHIREREAARHQLGRAVGGGVAGAWHQERR
jgi:MurNAc alpha-1-phosphate uridylyltransferase